MSDEKLHGLMPHNDGFPNLSRDWKDIDCNATSCLFNKNKKCIVPSRAEINEEGRCSGFKTSY